MLVKTNYVNIIEGKKHFVKEQKENNQKAGINTGTFLLAYYTKHRTGRKSLRHEEIAVEVQSSVRG